MLKVAVDAVIIHLSKIFAKLKGGLCDYKLNLLEEVEGLPVTQNQIIVNLGLRFWNREKPTFGLSFSLSLKAQP